MTDLPFLSLPHAECAHSDVRPDPDHPYDGICQACGEGGFPMVHEGVAVAIDEFVDDLWAFLIHRHGGVVPVALQPKDAIKDELRRRALALVQTPLDPEPWDEVCEDHALKDEGEPYPQGGEPQAQVQTEVPARQAQDV